MPTLITPQPCRRRNHVATSRERSNVVHLPRREGGGAGEGGGEDDGVTSPPGKEKRQRSFSKISTAGEPVYSI